MPDVDALAALYLFQMVPRQHLAALVEQAGRLSLTRGQGVFREGEVADRALLVMTGRLEAVLDGEVLGDIRPGEVVGETALFVPGGRRQADVRAAEDSTCLVLRPATLVQGRDNPAVIALQRHLVGTLGRRIRTTNLHLQQQWRAQQASRQPTAPPGVVERLRAFFGISQ